MKTIIITFTLLFLVFVLFQSFTYMSTGKTEEQKYTVVQKEPEFEIRLYPSATLATINSTAKTYKELSGPGFRKLAGFIFGGNESQKQISMTSPVHMDINDTLSTMSFVMPSDYNEQNLPKPLDSEVLIKTTNEEYVAAIEFGGYASQKEIKDYSEKLKKLLDEKQIITIGNFRYLGYNPPFQLIGRRNEIVVSIEWEN